MQFEQHPVDRLAAIRQEIRRLRIEAKQIRTQIMLGEVSPYGDTHKAEVQRRLVVRPLEPDG